MPTFFCASSWCRAIVPCLALVACDDRIESRSRPRPLENSIGCTFIVLQQFISSSLYYPSLTPPWDGAHRIGKLVEITENLSFLSCQGQSRTGITSMQTLSSSIGGLNRKISRKALKVITVDKKGICSGSIAADTSTLSYLRGGPGSWSAIGFFEPRYSMYHSFDVMFGCEGLRHFSVLTCIPLRQRYWSLK